MKDDFSRSQKQNILNSKILSKLSGKAAKTAEIILYDEEIEVLQKYANVVSIKRFGFNDHGRVHMRIVALNALIMAELLKDAGIKLNLEKEYTGTFEESQIVLLLASFLHDIGMTITREKHEYTGAILAIPIIDRIVNEIYKDDIEKKVMIRSMTLECILGHMSTQKTRSLESGLILIADGCDMEKGRAEKPMKYNKEPQVGDIHKYSAASIESVKIEKGSRLPIKITVEMLSSVGFFQIEEVLFTKINSSSIKPYIELYAHVKGEEMKCYL